MPTASRQFWVGVVSREHVQLGVKGGFIQLGHGKKAPLQRLRAGDALVMYSPRTRYPTGEALQAFTAIGVVSTGKVYQAEMTDDFKTVQGRRRVPRGARGAYQAPHQWLVVHKEQDTLGCRVPLRSDQDTRQRLQAHRQGNGRRVSLRSRGPPQVNGSVRRTVTSQPIKGLITSRLTRRFSGLANRGRADSLRPRLKPTLGTRLTFV